MDIKDINYVGLQEFEKGLRANILWQPNNFCNYDCSYCWPSTHTRVKDFVDTEVGLSGIDQLVDQFLNQGVEIINWGWSGGEPTFHPGFLNFLEKIDSHSNRVKMTTNLTTNLSQNITWWAQFIDVVKNFRYVKVNGSLHQEYVNTKEQVERFTDKLLFLKDNGVKVLINQVLTVENFYNQLESCKKFEDLGITVNYKIDSQVIKGANKSTYIKDQLDFFYNHKRSYKINNYFVARTKDGKEHLFDSVENYKPYGNLNFNGWLCYAGFYSVSIKHDEVVRGIGTCRDESLGNFRDGFKLYNIPNPCYINKICSCAADVKIPKYR